MYSKFAYTIHHDAHRFGASIKYLRLPTSGYKEEIDEVCGLNVQATMSTE